MLAVAISVLTASVLGSTHCAAMCGGFPTMLNRQNQNNLVSQSLYHLGRLISYVALGAAAGALGHSINDVGELAGFHQVAMYLTGAVLIIMGIRQLMGHPLEWASTLTGWFSISKFMSKFVSKPGYGSSFLLGFSASFLPCAWLYSFVIVAAGTGTLLSGALIMLFFWLGTVPALALVGWVTRHLQSRFSKQVPMLVGVLFIVAGLWSFFHRLHMH